MKHVSDYGFLSDITLPWNEMSGKNILVTGATGLIASNLVEGLLQVNALLSLGLHVYALCRNVEVAQRRFSSYVSDNSLRLIIEDVVEYQNPRVRLDYIVHTASSACPKAFNENPVDVMKANILGTIRLLDDLAAQQGGRFLFVSSSEVYGENEDSLPVLTEDMCGPLDFDHFRSCYPESKRASETLCMSYAKQYSVDTVIVRPAFIYGAQMPDSNTRADVYFMRQAMAGKDIVMHSKGEQVRSYLYVKDCVSALLYVLLIGETNGIYNIGDEECVVTLREYAERIAMAAHVDVREELKHSDSTAYLKRTRCVLDASKLRNLSWKPIYSIEEGLMEVFGNTL